jgi:translation initiation factor IF-3
VRFLKAGDKVKCTVIFRGREIQHTALAEVLLMRMAKDLEENAEIQQPPKREGRNMIMFLSPRKLAAGKSAAGDGKAKTAREGKDGKEPRPVRVVTTGTAAAAASAD